MNNYRSLSLLGLSALLAGFASAQGRLEHVQTTKSGSGVEVSVVGKNLPAPKTSTGQGGKVYYFDFSAKWMKPTGKQSVQWAGLDSVRTTWHGKPPKARVALYFAAAGAKPTVAKTADGWKLTVGNVLAASGSGNPYAAVYSGKSDTLPPLHSAFRPQTAVSPGAIIATPVSGPPTTGGSGSLAGALAEAGIGSAKTKVPMVSLDFSNVEVVLIMRALADQAGVNIVTSPDVSGRISVNLNDVPLTEALNLVTTIANIRYTKIGSTYLVTSTARFSDAIRQVIGRIDEPGATRVVQLRSGEGKQIKAATLKALPQLASNGYYDLILPTDKISAKTISGAGSTQATGDAGGTSGAGQGPQSGGGAAGGASQTKEAQGAVVELSADAQGVEGKDTYVVVVANPERINEVVSFVEGLDRNIAEANSLTGTAAIATRAIPLYSPNDSVVLEAVKGMASRDPRSSSYKIFVSSAGIAGQTNAPKLIVISGPSSGIDDLAYLAQMTDRSIAMAVGIALPQDMNAAERVYEVYDLHWVDPAYAMQEVSRRILGVSASVLPAPAEPGKAATVTSSYTSNNGPNGGLSTGDMGKSQNGGANGANGANSGPEVKVQEQNSESKTELTGTEPMKLLLYGTRSQIEQAKALLAILDLEPKQVAFEMLVLELTKEDLLRAGLDWSIFTGQNLGPVRINQALGGATGSGGFSLGNPNRPHSGSVAGILDHLTTKNNLISRPNTMALDGRPSTIFVGDTVRYVESIQSTQNGITITTGKVNVGVSLVVAPRVGADGSMTIQMSPTLTLLRGFTPVPGGGSLPQTSDRRADLQFTMQDGETIAIGGLISEQDRKTFGGVPILRDLPLIGRIFGRTENQRVRSEVVFFVTARVVDSKTRGKAADPRQSEQKNPIDPTKIKP